MGSSSMRSPAGSSPSSDRVHELPPLPREFYLRDSAVVAPALLGKVLVVRHRRRWLAAEIVETEAYHEEDPASHSYAGVTGRTWPMFEEGGTCYVYLSYGINYCMNVVTGPKGRGEAVLLRAGRPLRGIETMLENRGAVALGREIMVMNGPGKLTQALGIGPSHNGLTFFRDDFKLVDVPGTSRGDIARSSRIGISKARDEQLRFYLRHSPYVSKARVVEPKSPRR